jgi:hypothetical protein
MEAGEDEVDVSTPFCEQGKETSDEVEARPALRRLDYFISKHSERANEVWSDRAGALRRGLDVSRGEGQARRSYRARCRGSERF